MAKLSEAKARLALDAVAAWMGRNGYGVIRDAAGNEVDVLAALDDTGNWREGVKIGPAPTGPEAAFKGLGPELRMDWDWPASAGGSGVPTVILEGGPGDWAYRVSGEVDFAALGIFAEPYASYALCLYPL